MRVPDLVELKNASEGLTDSDSVPEQAVSTSPRTRRRPKGFGKPVALLSVSHGAERSTPAEKEQTAGLNERQSSCSKGSAFYRCANGFTGCCSVNPCDPGKTCPDHQSKSNPSETTKGHTHGGAPTSHVSEHATSRPAHRSHTGTPHERHTRTTHEPAPLLSATRTRQPDSTSSARKTHHGHHPQATASSMPKCPAGNGTTIHDSTNVAYNLYCDMDNTYSSDSTITVGVGGYAECFSACSNGTDCAGFTYIGLDSGNCYLKNQMPSALYMAKDGSNYVSCAKVNFTPEAPSGEIGQTSSQKPAHLAVILGAVLGGVGFIGLMLLIIAFVARRKRQKIEERRASIIIQGPMETQQLGSAGHQRQGSTSHDAFQQFGGSYYSPQHTRQRSIYRDQQWV